MRARIIQSPGFTGEKVIGAILFERTINEQIAGTPVPVAHLTVRAKEGIWLEICKRQR